MPTAVLVSVGDELLEGFTLNTNAHWAAQQLRDLGIRVVRMETVADDPDAIARAVRAGLVDADVVVVGGGLGPTPDDRTNEGVALGLGVELQADQGDVKRLRARTVEADYAADLWDDPDRREGLVRMVRVPRTATRLANRVGAALGSWIEGDGGAVAVLPGVPDEFKDMFRREVVPRLPKAEAQAVEELVVTGEEARWYAVLRRLEASHPAVKVGSYPAAGRITLRVQGPAAGVRDVVGALREFASRPADA